jgi:hypothetical protein
MGRMADKVPRFQDYEERRVIHSADTGPPQKAFQRVEVSLGKFIALLSRGRISYLVTGETDNQ